MSWRASIESVRTTGYGKNDYPYCTNGFIKDRETALKRAEIIFKKRKYNPKEYIINVYESIFYGDEKIFK